MHTEDGRLQGLGARLRDERLRRNETQAIFAARIGVSVPTLRKMEGGDPTVLIGYWSRALEILDRAEDWDALLSAEEDLFDKYERLHAAPKRRRASGRRS